ncbi:Uncharacterized protein FWK35_00001101 [Aphis craccivora]|uniref:Uncharacterized protein n=1 Tax=Aphis craccivora TaxID=307492 RepID=A0A6G0ZPK1_APHCR|nr:Uncharacterized protein FWK35_00001101 [Aphis craccivora]
MCRVNAAKRFSNDCTGRGVNAQYARPRRRLVHRLTASRRSSVGTGSAPPCVSRRAFKAASEPAAAAVLPPICRVPRSPARCSYATGTHVQPSCRPPSPPYLIFLVVGCERSSLAAHVVHSDDIQISRHFINDNNIIIIPYGTPCAHYGRAHCSERDSVAVCPANACRVIVLRYVHKCNDLMKKDTVSRTIITSFLCLSQFSLKSRVTNDGRNLSSKRYETYYHQKRVSYVTEISKARQYDQLIRSSGLCGCQTPYASDLKSQVLKPY